MTTSLKSATGSKTRIELGRDEEAGAPEVVYSVQFSRDEIRAIRSVAREDGISTAEWIRLAAFERAVSRAANS